MKNRFSDILIITLRWLLLPASLIYGLVMLVRNKLYDKGVLKSYTPPCKSICVGNLAVGGTGKSPLTMWLISLLGKQYNIAVLSRGYGRKTRGFRIVETSSSSEQCGDEPLMIKRKYPDTTVAVCEDRVYGAKRLMELHPDIQILILDDAMQHRSIKCGLTILTTQYGKLYNDDIMIPTGYLREPAIGAKRADIIVVTKCPQRLLEDSEGALTERKEVLSRLRADNITFSAIKYGTPTDAEGNPVTLTKNIIVTTGIANPYPLIEYLKNSNYEVEGTFFADHYQFSEKDLLFLQSKYEESGVDTTILTTEKDLVRMINLKAFDTLKSHLAVLPIEPIFDKEDILTSKIRYYANKD